MKYGLLPVVEEVQFLRLNESVNLARNLDCAWSLIQCLTHVSQNYHSTDLGNDDLHTLDISLPM